MIMKYSIRTSFLLIAAMLMVWGCADAQQMKPKNILIVYLSRTKNTSCCRNDKAKCWGNLG
jgi:hypothetical protein